jgi:hypothetical protein
MHRAGAALAQAAAVFGAVQRQLVAQHVQQWRGGIGIDPLRDAIHHDGHGHG